MSGNVAEVVERLTIEKLMIQGQSALRQGKNAEAYSQFSRIIALDPGNKDVYPFRAEALLRMGKLGEAEQDLDQQESPAAIVRRLLSQANYYMDNRDFDGAEQTILKAKRYDGTSSQKTDAALMLGVLYAATERYEAAKEQYKEAQAAMPNEDNDTHYAKIIGLNALIQVKELADNRHESTNRWTELADDFIQAHEDIIPRYIPGHNVAKIAVSIAAGRVDDAAWNLWRVISTNMEHTNISLRSQSALSNNSCLATTPGLPIVSSKLIAGHTEKDRQSFAEMVLEPSCLNAKWVR